MTATQVQQLGRHQVLFKEGDEATNFYSLVSGKLAVFRQKKFVRAVSGRGIFVGEMGTLLGSKRSATMIALEPSSLIPIPKSIDKIFEIHPDIGLKLLESLRRRLSETYDQAEKVWASVLKEITELLIYEATAKTVAKKSLAVDQVEAERKLVRQFVVREIESEEFDYSKISTLLKRWDIESEYPKHLREKYPRFKYVDLKKTRDLWKKHVMDTIPDKMQHCIGLVSALNELTEFTTSFGFQDESTGMEELDMLESSIPLDRRTAFLRAIAQKVLTPKEGIEKMKRINRDIDTDVEEADRHERRTSRVFHLSGPAKKFGIETEYIDELRKEFWEVCHRN